MTLAASGDFLRANDPDVLRRLEAVETSSAAALPSAGLGAAIAALGLPLSTTTTLTAAQLSTLADTPVELVTAPGANNLAVVDRIVTLIDPGDGGSGVNLTGDVSLNYDPNIEILAALLGAAVVEDQKIKNTYCTLDASALNLINKALTITSATNPTLLGAVATMSLNVAGELWRPNDTAYLSGGNDNATLIVDTVTNSYPIIGVNQGAKTFTIAGDHSDFAASDVLTVYRSTGNDGMEAYTVVSAVFGGVNTVITVVEAIPSAVADGYLGNELGGATPTGAIATYHMTAAGTGYAETSYTPLTSMAAPNDTGLGASINVDTIDTSGNTATLKVTTFYTVMGV